MCSFGRGDGREYGVLRIAAPVEPGLSAGYRPLVSPAGETTVKRTLEIEDRNAEDCPEFRGVMLQERLAASGGPAEVFAPGSLAWPATGVEIAVGHDGESEIRAFPHRGPDRPLSLRSRAAVAIKRAVAAGQRWMSVEFVALRERTTIFGVCEILSAMLPRAVLTDRPEYDTTAAEIQTAAWKRRRKWQV